MALNRSTQICDLREFIRSNMGAAGQFTNKHLDQFVLCFLSLFISDTAYITVQESETRTPFYLLFCYRFYDLKMFYFISYLLLLLITFFQVWCYLFILFSLVSGSFLHIINGAFSVILHLFSQMMPKFGSIHPLIQA